MFAFLLFVFPHSKTASVLWGGFREKMGESSKCAACSRDFRVLSGNFLDRRGCRALCGGLFCHIRSDCIYGT